MVELIKHDGEILEEEWDTVRDFPSYIVSNYGRVVSLRRDREMAQRLGDWGYFSVAMTECGSQKVRMVHRLVAECFVPGWDHGLVVNHIDGVKTNNVDTNLEWCTYSDNMRHAHRLGLNSGRGLSVEIVETGQSFSSIAACAKYLGGSDGRIHDVITGKRPGYRGMTFRYL